MEIVLLIWAILATIMWIIQGYLTSAFKKEAHKAIDGWLEAIAIAEQANILSHEINASLRSLEQSWINHNNIFHAELGKPAPTEVKYDA